MSENILSASHIHKQYATYKALDDVSIEIPRGKILGMLGPNGAGKTTMIRIINQIIAPDSGELVFNGEKLKPSHIEKIGYLPEERGLYKKMKVGEQALYLAQLKGLSSSDAKRKLNYWFEKFELQAWWNKKVEELSKGMQQKVQFITTILHEPELVILDEPFTGFDPINAELVKNEVLQMKANGTSFIISTHRMESVEELCDEIALINKSHKVLGGRVKEIRKQYKSNIYHCKLISTAENWNQLQSKFSMTAISHDEDEYQFSIENKEQSNELIKILMQYGNIIEFREKIPSMSEIFIETVTKSSSNIVSYE